MHPILTGRTSSVDLNYPDEIENLQVIFFRKSTPDGCPVESAVSEQECLATLLNGTCLCHSPRM